MPSPRSTGVRPSPPMPSDQPRSDQSPPRPPDGRGDVAHGGGASMRGRPWRLGASIVAAIVLMTVLCAWLFRPQPTLSGVVERLASGHYDALEGQLLAYLRASPRDQVARLMLARASVDRPDPKPELALEQL